MPPRLLRPAFSRHFSLRCLRFATPIYYAVSIFAMKLSFRHTPHYLIADERSFSPFSLRRHYADAIFATLLILMPLADSPITLFAIFAAG